MCTDQQIIYDFGKLQYLPVYSLSVISENKSEVSGDSISLKSLFVA